MLARLQAFSLLGIDVVHVEVEFDVSVAAKRTAILVGLPEAEAVVEDLDVIPVSSLAEAFAFLAGQLEIEPVPSRLAGFSVHTPASPTLALKN